MRQEGNRKIEPGRIIAGVLHLPCRYLMEARLDCLSYSLKRKNWFLPAKGGKQGVKMIKGIWAPKQNHWKQIWMAYLPVRQPAQKNGSSSGNLRFISLRMKPFSGACERMTCGDAVDRSTWIPPLPSAGIYFRFYDKEKEETTWVIQLFGIFQRK